MIPKTIHYVWLSDDPKPEDTKACIRSWEEVLPDYTVRKWSMGEFPLEEMPEYVREAIDIKKWTFATDYLRLWVLYHEGGIYLDSDILMKKRIDGFLNNGFFSFIEFHKEGFLPYKDRIDKNGKALTDMHVPGFCMQAAFMGAEKEHPFIRDCMDYYSGRSFLTREGKADMSILAPDIYALCARKYGFVYKDCKQQLSNRMTIYPSSYVAGTRYLAKDENYAVHCCAGSWRDVSFKQRLKIKIKSIIR